MGWDGMGQRTLIEGVCLTLGVRAREMEVLSGRVLRLVPRVNTEADDGYAPIGRKHTVMTNLARPTRGSFCSSSRSSHRGSKCTPWINTIPVPTCLLTTCHILY